MSWKIQLVHIHIHPSTELISLILFVFEATENDFVNKITRLIFLEICQPDLGIET